MNQGKGQKAKGKREEGEVDMDCESSFLLPPSSLPAWTAEQEAAIRFGGGSVLVSAAAGSGKTAVLAARCAHLVCDAEAPCDVDELLVVTFTEAAAAEMKQRIGRALRDRLSRLERGQAPTPAREAGRLARQIALIERAQVSTLHGFCAQVVRQHYHLLGLDPAFTILDGDEAALLRNETVRELFLQRYEAEESGDFQRMIDSFGDGNDERLMRQVVATHELLASLVDPAAWRAEARRRIEQAAEGVLEESDLGRELVGIVQRQLATLLEQCRSAGVTVAGMAGFEKYTQVLREWYQVIRHWQNVLAGDGLDALGEEARGMQWNRLPSIPSATPGKEVAQGLVEAVRKGMKEGPVVDALQFSSAQWQEGLRRTLPFVEVYLGLVEAFGQMYAKAKQPLRALDFSDLERLALQALRQPEAEGLHPSPAARQYQRQFRHVLVDEYQDINQVQDAILTLVSGDQKAKGKRQKAKGEEEETSKTPCSPATRNPQPATNSFFCVGDVKQSIYRFRLAEPGRFLEREARFRGDASAGKVIDLQKNFRSRGPLLEAMNDVFERLMTAEAADIVYDAAHRLYPGAMFPEANGAAAFAGAPLELHLLPKTMGTDAEAEASGEGEAGEGANEFDRTALEATLLARRIGQMMGTDGSVRMNVAERDGTLRPIEYRDIVILLRSMRFKAEQFAEVLRQSGIPVHSESGTGYFESMEVRDVLALLGILDNQRQDIPLAAVLRSPLAQLPQVEDALARIRLAFGGEAEPPAFHEAVVRYAAERTDELSSQLRHLLERLQRWRDLAQRRPLAEVIWTIYQESGYLAFVSGLHGGQQRVANLLHLHERARQFGNFQRQGLYRFLRFLEQLREEKDLGQPSTASDADDVVRIMSIHHAKGLEFPVVLLPDLGKRHNLADSAGSILVDRQAYLGMSVVDEARRIRYPSLSLTLVQQRLRQQSLAEELRLLYVAMTRAREHLICVGTCGEGAWDKWQARWRAHAGALPAEMVLAGGCVLDWLGPVAAALGPAGAIEVIPHGSQEIAAWPTSQQRRPALDERQQALAELKPLVPPPAETDLVRAVRERLTSHYPFEAMTQTAAARAATAAAWEAPIGPAATQGQKAARAGLRLPAFMRGQEPAEHALERGTATHRVLQWLDFAHAATAEELKEQLQALRERRVLSEQEAGLVDEPALHWLMGSEVGALLQTHARQLMRELPFALAVAPEILPAGVSLQPLDQVMVRGRLDVVVPTEAGLVVVDYKTDAVRRPEDLPALTARHEPQARLYARALHTITQRPVAAVYLVFLAGRRIVRVAL